MKVAELLEARRANWSELERLCAEIERRRKMPPQQILRFGTLYRAACADLALADAYQLPPGTVQYLHRLVGRAHNQLYRSRVFDYQRWGQTLLIDVPRRIFHDRCVWLCFLLFWGVFLFSALAAAMPKYWPGFTEAVVPVEQLDMIEEMYSKPIGSNGSPMTPAGAAFYIQHNTSIGLQCFAGMLLVIPGFIVTVFNANQLGTIFGYMARPDVVQGVNFFDFVVAHGPFELTAIILSAGAGLRLGMSWVYTRGLGRIASLRQTARQTMPVMGAAMCLFFLAALIEGFLSPSAAPQWIKDAVAVGSSVLLMFYFVLLGSGRERTDGI